MSLGQFLLEYPQQVNDIHYNGFELLDYDKLESHVKERGARKIDVSEIPSSEVLELDEIRLKRGLISPVDFIEQKKRQFINEGIQELITDD